MTGGADGFLQTAMSSAPCARPTRTKLNTVVGWHNRADGRLKMLQQGTHEPSTSREAQEEGRVCPPLPVPLPPVEACQPPVAPSPLPPWLPAPQLLVHLPHLPAPWLPLSPPVFSNSSCLVFNHRWWKSIMKPLCS